MASTRTSRRLAALSVTVLMAACDGRSPVTPSLRPTPAPGTTIPTAPTTPTIPFVYHTLSGVVFELTPDGRAVVADVEVYCESCDPPLGHSMTKTDAAGGYHFNQAEDGSHLVLLSKPGYRLPRPDWTGAGGIGWMGGINAHVAGDTRFDIEIVRE